MPTSPVKELDVQKAEAAKKVASDEAKLTKVEGYVIKAPVAEAIERGEEPGLLYIEENTQLQIHPHITTEGRVIEPQVVTLSRGKGVCFDRDVAAFIRDYYGYKVFAVSKDRKNTILAKEAQLLALAEQNEAL